MIRNDCRAILEVELLEERCAAASIAPASAPHAHPVNAELATQLVVVSGAFPSSLPAPIAATSPTALTVLGGVAPALFPTALPSSSFVKPPAPAVNPSPILPIGAGAQTLNNSIPNAANVLSGRTGLASLSPFLPAYNLSYTQTGPFYTGSGPGLTAANPSESSYNESQVVSPMTVDDLFELWGMELSWLPTA